MEKMCCGAQKQSPLVTRAVHSRIAISVGCVCPSVVLELITMDALGGQTGPWSHWLQGHASCGGFSGGFSATGGWGRLPVQWAVSSGEGGMELLLAC